MADQEVVDLHVGTEIKSVTYLRKTTFSASTTGVYFCMKRKNKNKMKAGKSQCVWTVQNVDMWSSPTVLIYTYTSYC